MEFKDGQHVVGFPVIDGEMRLTTGIVRLKPKAKRTFEVWTRYGPYDASTFIWSHNFKVACRLALEQLANWADPLTPWRQREKLDAFTMAREVMSIMRKWRKYKRFKARARA